MKPAVGIIMGSQSDWSTMQRAAETLDALAVAYETRIVSAHRTPARLYRYARGAAHLPGMTASMTSLPVFGVPIESRALKGLDSLLSIAQMPAGIPVGTLAIGEAGAVNAALLAASVLALGDRKIAAALAKWRKARTNAVAKSPRPES